MSVLDKVYKSFMDYFVSSDPKWDPDRVVCTVDDNEVDCFTDELESKGYTYNDIRDWWEREWTTNQGQESIIEAYKKGDDGWKSIMIGYGDRVFYEEKV